jgi:hypothetical protein
MFHRDRAVGKSGAMCRSGPVNVTKHSPARAAPAAVKKQFPQFKAVEACADLMKLVKAAVGQPLDFKL